MSATVDKLSRLLTSVDIPPSRLNLGEQQSSTAKIVFSINWFFEVNVKDTVLNSLTQNDNIVDEDALNNFEMSQSTSLSQDNKIKKRFCTGLQSKSAIELFKLANKVNKISARSIKGKCTCSDCRGTKKVNCPNCTGYGLILCPSCQGREGGCSRCRKTGYIECPTCHKMQKVACQRCRGTGRTFVERTICLIAKNFPLIEVEYLETNHLTNIPQCTVDHSCYHDILARLPFKIDDMESKDSGVYKLTYSTETDVDYLPFFITGLNKNFRFFTAGPQSVALNMPPVLDTAYYVLRSQLADAALGNTLTDHEVKIELFKNLCRNPFLYSLLRGYEYDYEGITRKIQGELETTDRYTSKLFTMKEKLASIVANRKEQLAEVLSKKLLASTNNLMRPEFSQELCLAIVEFVSNLKFRGSGGRHYWDMATTTVWTLSFLLNFFAPHPINMVLSFVFVLISFFAVSYYGTKSLRLYEVLKSSHTFTNISKFIDFNYDVVRAMVMFTGVTIIELVIYLVI